MFVFVISICVSLGSTLGGPPDIIVYIFTLGFGAWFFCCLLGYLCITCSDFFSTFFRLTLCLFVDFCSDTLEMTLNSSSRFLIVVLCVSCIASNVAFGVGFFDASTKSCADNVPASAYDTLGVFTFYRKYSTTSATISDLISVTNTL